MPRRAGMVMIRCSARARAYPSSVGLRQFEVLLRRASSTLLKSSRSMPLPTVLHFLITRSEKIAIKARMKHNGCFLSMAGLNPAHGLAPTELDHISTMSEGRNNCAPMIIPDRPRRIQPILRTIMFGVYPKLLAIPVSWCLYDSIHFIPWRRGVVLFLLVLASTPGYSSGYTGHCFQRAFTKYISLC